MADEPQTDCRASWQVSIFVEVVDPGALWEAAIANLLEESRGDVDALAHLGTAEEPDVANCLRQLADPGASWPGTKILDSAAEGG